MRPILLSLFLAMDVVWLAAWVPASTFQRDDLYSEFVSEINIPSPPLSC